MSNDKLPNAPVVHLGIVAVSRDCFPAPLSRGRAGRLVTACREKGLEIHLAGVLVENEQHVLAALEELKDQDVNALVVYHGNFGPEGPSSLLAEKFDGPVMYCGAAEGDGDLFQGRGDALCGLLSASYNLDLRQKRVYFPERPIGLPRELAPSIKHFADVARLVIGASGLKIVTFGGAPQDFITCQASTEELSWLGVSPMQNSELDLLHLFEDVAETDPQVAEVAARMAHELGEGNAHPDLLPRLARLEVALVRAAEAYRGASQYVIFANKCWPAFERAFGFVPCYVNSRMRRIGMLVACEHDIWGALSEYLCYLATGEPGTLLDVNNSVPADMIEGLNVRADDLVMLFHCGNTPSCHLQAGARLGHQLIMQRLMDPAITRGVLEGQIKPGPATLFRLQPDATTGLKSYIAPGKFLDVDPQTFGGSGVFELGDFSRFYRHVLLGRAFPHHGAIGFGNCGRVLYDALQLMGIRDISFPLAGDQRYPGENPFSTG